MDRRQAAAARARVERVCRTATSPTALHRSVAAAAATTVPFDMWCGLTLDPATALLTGGYHDEGFPPSHRPRQIELEYGDGEGDVGLIHQVARSPRPVSLLSAATGGDVARSARYRDVLEPLGMRHELRVVCRTGDDPWGALVLARGGDVPDFRPDEVELLGRLSSRVGDALRRILVLGEVPTSEQLDGPGLLLLSVGETDVTIISTTEAARRWLADVEDDWVDGMPHAILAQARAAAARRHGGPLRCRLRTRAGRWLTVHAEQLDDATFSVILEPSRPADIAILLSDAYRLSPREIEITGLAVRGFSNREVGTRLWLSPYTVADHLKKIFDKVGVRSRGELASRLFFDHYASLR